MGMKSLPFPIVYIAKPDLALWMSACGACRIETINAVEAWSGSLPRDGYSNMRRVMLHTLNFADMLPITSPRLRGLRDGSELLRRS
jgi:hypothetical protein